MQRQTFHIFCARCGKNHSEDAVTIAGAIKRVTLRCNGRIQTAQGIRLTRCATGFDPGNEE